MRDATSSTPGTRLRPLPNPLVIPIVPAAVPSQFIYSWDVLQWGVFYENTNFDNVWQL